MQLHVPFGATRQWTLQACVDAGSSRRPCRLEAAEEEDDTSLGHQDSASTDCRPSTKTSLCEDALRGALKARADRRPGTGSLALS